MANGFGQSFLQGVQTGVQAIATRQRTQLAQRQFQLQVARFKLDRRLAEHQIASEMMDKAAMVELGEVQLLLGRGEIDAANDRMLEIFIKRPGVFATPSGQQTFQRVQSSFQFSEIRRQNQERIDLARAPDPRDSPEARAREEFSRTFDTVMAAETREGGPVNLNKVEAKTREIVIRKGFDPALLPPSDDPLIQQVHQKASLDLQIEALQRDVDAKRETAEKRPFFGLPGIPGLPLGILGPPGLSPEGRRSFLEANDPRFAELRQLETQLENLKRRRANIGAFMQPAAGPTEPRPEGAGGITNEEVQQWLRQQP